MRRKRDIPGLDKALQMLQHLDDGPVTPQQWGEALQHLMKLQEAGLLWRLELYYRTRRAYCEAAWVTEHDHRVVMFRVWSLDVSNQEV